MPVNFPACDGSVRKYPNSDRAFGEPPLFSCTNSYKRVLEAHLVEAVAKITRSYEVCMYVGTTYTRGEQPWHLGEVRSNALVFSYG